MLKPQEKQLIQINYNAKATTEDKEFIVFDWSNKLSTQTNSLLVTGKSLEVL